VVFFGSHYPDVVKGDVMQRLGVQSEALQEKYLGMPTEVGRSPTAPSTICIIACGSI
jgi:hypothetical protein